MAPAAAETTGEETTGEETTGEETAGEETDPAILPGDEAEGDAVAASAAAIEATTYQPYPPYPTETCKGGFGACLSLLTFQGTVVSRLPRRLQRFFRQRGGGRM